MTSTASWRSKDGLPRTFTFDAVNFDSGTANLRGAGQ